MSRNETRSTPSHGASALPPTAFPEGSVTRRALLLGALGALAIGLGGPWVDNVIRGSYMTLDFSTPGAIFLLFLLAAVPQMILWRLRSRLRFTVAEMVTVYSMMVVSSGICTQGLTSYLIPVPTGPFYYATPANKWASLIVPHIPTWAAPVGSEVGAPAIRHLYDGLPMGRSVPWGAWLPMLGAWLPLLIAVYLIMIATMVIMRRQWVDNERLTYSLTQLPLELAGERSGGFPALLTNRIFWAGLSVPFALGMLKGLHFYFPQVPTITQLWAFPVFRNQQSFHIEISWALMGFFYLVTSEGTFSLWFFNRLYFIAKGVMGITGISGSEVMGNVGGSTEPYFIHLCTGAFVLMFATSIWVARGHLGRVWRSATAWGKRTDDGEIISLGTAVWMTVVCLAFLVWWIAQTGMPLLGNLLLILMAFVMFTVMTRVVAEVGFAAATAPKPAPNIPISWLGSTYMGPAGIVSAGLAYVWCSEARTFVMASVANSLRAAHVITRNRRGLFWAYMLAIGISVASSVWITLARGYTQGGITMNAWYFNNGLKGLYQYLENKITNPAGPAWYGLGLAAAGGAIYYLLSLMRSRYVSWPFHPVGFAISSIWMMDVIWFTALISWLLKLMILRYGGNRAFTALRPAFLGLICGQFTINAIWLVVDQITGKTGNIVFWI